MMRLLMINLLFKYYLMYLFFISDKLYDLQI